MTPILAVRGFPNLFLTVVFGVVYRNVSVDISQSERRYLYFISYKNMYQRVLVDVNILWLK